MFYEVFAADYDPINDVPYDTVRFRSRSYRDAEAYAGERYAEDGEAARIVRVDEAWPDGAHEGEC